MDERIKHVAMDLSNGNLIVKGYISRIFADEQVSQK